MKNLILTLSLCSLAPVAMSGPPVINEVTYRYNGSKWAFNVTVEHGDTGWDHYADGWGIYTPDGTELGYRVLAHPHVNEQPFTRSLGSVTIPQTINTVIIVPNDSVHGKGSPFEVELKR